MKNILMLSLLTILASCGGQEAKTTAVDEAVSQKVLDHHIQTFQANDLEGVMADYTEESVLITPDATFKGLAEIRKNFEGAFSVLPTSGTTMTVTKTVVAGRIAYMVWKATTPTLDFKYATDTFIIEDGKIISQTFAGDIVPVSTAAPVPGE